MSKKSCDVQPGQGDFGNQGGRSLLAKLCVGLLAVLMIAITVQNGQYFARGHHLHLLPMLLVCATAWVMLRDAPPPRPISVFWALATACLACIVLELYFEIYKRKPFDEDGAVTLLSFSMLLLTSFATLRIWLQRKVPGPPRLVDKGTIWLLMAIGFLYLAIDEKSLLHEGFDTSLHKFLGITPTAWTSRIDDMLVGLYGVIGMVALWLYRAEITHFSGCLRLLKLGFVALFLCVITDVATNRSDLFIWLLGPVDGLLAYEFFGEAEEVFKVLAEALFLTGFAHALRTEYDEKAAGARQSA